MNRVRLRSGSPVECVQTLVFLHSRSRDESALQVLVISPISVGKKWRKTKVIDDHDDRRLTMPIDFMIL